MKSASIGRVSGGWEYEELRRNGQLVSSAQTSVTLSMSLLFSCIILPARIVYFPSFTTSER